MLTEKDKSFGITIGVNNFTFWKHKLRIYKLNKPELYTLAIVLGWITIIISSPAAYHINAAFQESIAELNEEIENLKKGVNHE